MVAIVASVRLRRLRQRLFRNSWGDSANGASVNVIPGDYVFTSGDIDVYAKDLPPWTGSGSGPSTYNFMTVETAGMMGLGRVLRLNNIIAEFDIESAVSSTDTVCFEIRAEGNNAQFSVNGTTIATPDPGLIANWDGLSIGGCTLSISGAAETTANGSVVAYTATITVMGDVETLLSVETCFIDDLCISVPEGPLHSLTSSRTKGQSCWR